MKVMEKEKHNDRLDDYVRQSFGNYEEIPPDDMWERVESALPPGEDKRRPLLLLLFLRRRLAAAVAMLLLVSLAAWHYCYFVRKDLTLPPAEAVHQPFAGKITTDHPQTTVAGIPENARADSASFGHGAPGERASGKQQDAGKGNPRVFFVLSATSQAVEGDSATSQNLIQGNIVPADTGGWDGSNLLPDGEARAALALLPSSTLLPAWQRPPAEPFRPAPDPAPATLAKQAARWYLGVYLSPRLVFDASATPIRRPGMRPVFVSRQERPEVMLEGGLRLGRKLGTHWAVEGGIGFGRLSRTTVHAPRFRYGEGSYAGAQARRFEYALSSYAGSASITLDIERTDADPVNNNEPVQLSVRVAEKLELLRIPLTGVYQFGAGSLQGLLKAGMTGNFILNNEMGIATRVSSTGRFRPVQGSDGYTIKSGQAQRFFPGYCLAAGGIYQPKQWLGLSVELSFSGDFARNNAAGQRLPGQYAPALNAGANFYF
jgi:hypothetical protein